jgi:hypothetical protein
MVSSELMSEAGFGGTLGEMIDLADESDKAAAAAQTQQLTDSPNDSEKERKYDELSDPGDEQSPQHADDANDATAHEHKVDDSEVLEPPKAGQRLSSARVAWTHEQAMWLLQVMAEYMSTPAGGNRIPPGPRTVKGAKLPPAWYAIADGVPSLKLIADKTAGAKAAANKWHKIKQDMKVSSSCSSLALASFARHTLTLAHHVCCSGFDRNVQERVDRGVEAARACARAGTAWHHRARRRCTGGSSKSARHQDSRHLQRTHALRHLALSVEDRHRQQVDHAAARVALVG